MIRSAQELTITLSQAIRVATQSQLFLPLTVNIQSLLFYISYFHKTVSPRFPLKPW
jgi:hypothetical protein